MSEEHENFIKTPKQLVIIVVLSFVIPIGFIVLLTQLMTGDKNLRPDEQPVAIAERLKPVGNLVVAGPKVLLAGDKLYAAVCQACHATGLAGSHKLGDKTAWAKVIAQGQAMTVTHALSGIRAMPARGGNPDLTDEEVAGAVVYMANQAGATWKAPELKMPAGAPAQAAAPAAAAAAPAPAEAKPAAAAPAAAAPAAAPTQAAAAGGKGKAIYDVTCFACHATSVANSPKFGDKAAWAPRIATGMDALYNSALKGKNAMPMKGGNVTLPDADVKAAVDYMVAAAK